MIEESSQLTHSNGTSKNGHDGLHNSAAWSAQDAHTQRHPSVSMQMVIQVIKIKQLAF